ncbi:hypothetical protein SS1G_12731 [Sclerotinia sclerotiorum 1980 UF-70]|uniref:Uncharacterized protein n=2 Tax=Sclerotinia sclerotiorum (strain ATCC 18683 / 1980 / Ss-1) TaxID=665079 RepID=A0A1D9PVC1_SCLS1|nr:hypothetical protein SS1G_12731 [Sclerotinia sclerotiorum 1980 UF-70]APA06559.1 hypothetical protein sscle_02g013290 [Sclerotinia sclerotiorum 1980 UF-70]EDN97877.1 hypothetical protein SS1G_12731 [Sclerotinia sclerotiorum 1980 UF-70]
MDLYQQQPINLDRPAIRLLQLLKGTENIRCNLLTGWFDEPESIIPYSALPYTWGCTNKSCGITVGNTTINVIPNLNSALMHLRLEDKDRIYGLMPSLSIRIMFKKRSIKFVRWMPYIGLPKKLLFGWAMVLKRPTLL